MSFFEDLKASLEEAVDIKNGVKTPAQVSRYEGTDMKIIKEQFNSAEE